MTEFLVEYGLFLAKTVTWVVAILLVAAGIFALVREARVHYPQERLEVKNINERLEQMADILNSQLMTPLELRMAHRRRKAEHKARRKAEKAGTQPQRPRLFVLHFKGDLQASAADSLREEISAILQVGREGDEVLLRLESEGGMVHSYGFAASQLTRIRGKGLKLTAAVDKVAASGGYLMACVADRILAAPFAVVGSIGVVAQLPNFNRLLRKHDVDYELHTAGQYKRTLTLFGENTDEARSKFLEELEDTHALFKTFVAENRSVVDIEKVATGEHWFGARALALMLVDEIRTGDDYLLARAAEADVFEVRFKHKQSITDRITHGLMRLGPALRSRLQAL